MNRRNIIIHTGGMYQKWCYLMDLVEDDTAKSLEQLAIARGWREVQAAEAREMGFSELVDWSVPETDLLVLIGNEYLVCLNRIDYLSSMY